MGVVGKILQPEIRSLIDARNFSALRELFSEWPPADVAEIFPDLTAEAKIYVFRVLPRALALDVFEYLDAVEQAKLGRLAETIGELGNIQELTLYRHWLGIVPDSIGRLGELQRLSLDGNLLRTLPDSIGELRELRELYLDNNCFTALPRCIAYLTELRILSVGNNKLETLPKWLLRLKKLEALYLHGNQALSLPEEILGPALVTPLKKKPSPPSYILAYYARVHARASDDRDEPLAGTGSRPLLEARLIVIGDGASGKTSLVRQLLRDLPARDKEATTRDVVIEEWSVTVGNFVVQVNLWDFGGQKQMHAAHPYFFTTRTLYLIVAEARKDQQDRVDYWLKMVAKYGHTARALIAINKVEGHAMALDRPKLLDRYRKNLPEDASRAFFPTSCTSGTGIRPLRDAITEELETMDQIWALWPTEWFRVKDFIKQLRQPKNLRSQWLQRLLEFLPGFRPHSDGIDTLNYDEWRGICDNCGIRDEEDRDSLLANLAHLGQVVCFPGDPRLRHLGVLNPEWVTRGIYPLLVETKLAAKGGMISMEDLSEFLPRERYPKERHAWLVDLMKSFELIFEDDRGRLLLPGQLPADSPDWAQPKHWKGEEILHLELRYDVLPESVISQFIVRRHKEARLPGEWWRHGIALKRGACEALVRAHMTEQEARIELRLRGPRSERRELLASIRETLRDPKDTTPPEMYVILGDDCAPKYSELVIHAERTRELDFIIDGRSVTRPLAPILDMIESPSQKDSNRQGVQFNVNIQNENKPNMSHHENKSINITDSSLSNVVVGIDQMLQNSFNTIQNAGEGETKAALLSLHGQVAKLLESPQIRDRNIVKDDLEAFAKEATRDHPRREHLELSGKGLIEAAKTVGTMAPPIIATVQKILELVSA